MTAISFTAIGKPQPAGSKSGAPIRRKNGSIGVAMRDSNPKAKPWQAIVANAAREAYSGDLLRGPLYVKMTFYLPRPKGHFGTGRNAAKVKESAPQHPAKKPDVLKLARGTEDALSGVVFADDAQIVSEHLHKAWGEPARVEVEIMEVGT
jgi:Holliday junction resolvase RusA-like endonuclease